MDQHGQTEQKLKLVKNVQKLLKNDFCKLKAKKCFATKTSSKVFQKRFKLL